MSRFFTAIFIVAILALSVSSSPAQQTPHIRITGEGSGKNTITVAPMRDDKGQAALVFRKVLRDNLQRSGWFQTVDGESAGIRVSGNLSSAGGISVAVTVEWLPSGSFTWARRGAADDARPLALELCDEITRRVMGRPGMASAPILLVGKRAGGTDIYSCDSDGGRLRRITTDGKICLSPSWLPDRSGFLYTAYLKDFAAIHKVEFGPPARRELLAGFPGLNNGGVVSPDGKLAAMVLSLSGNVELYVMNLATKRLTRRTTTPHANESSPNWSPDGSQLVYVSDAGRSPQVYTMRSSDKEGKRLVFGLSESVAPDWGSDGTITFCGRQGGRYGIYTINPQTGGAPKLVSPADGRDYEDPSWAPDARHIVCTRTAGRRRSLVILDTLGDTPVELIPIEGEWYLADWSK